jgi:diguanylate cyclase (GGDEF)-like protein/PAS domain S-box-containing protein
MRGFRTKLLLPLIILVLSIGSFMEFYWLPNWERHVLEQRIEEERAYLDLLGSLLRTPLQSSDMASIYDLLDQLSVEKKQWEHLTLTRGDGLQLYPLSDTHAASLSGVPLSAQIVFDDNTLARLDVHLDVTAYLESERAQLRVLEQILLGIAFLAVLLVGWMQKALVLRPIDRLAIAARQIAAGNFDYKLSQYTKEGGIADFFHAFNVMQNSISEKHAALKREVAEREIAEQRLNDSQQVAQLGCWEWSAEDGGFWCSDSLMPIMCIDACEEVGFEAFCQHIHPADVASVRREFSRLQRGARSFESEFRIHAENGLRYVHMIGQCDLETGRCFGTCQDVTERKDIESSLRKLSSAITYSGSSVMITDIIGTIEYVNPKYSEATGFQLDELMGQQPEILSRRFMSDEKYEVLWHSILAGQNWRGELQSVRKDGSAYWSLVSISPIKNEFGELTHFVIVLEDVTELKDAHARMEQLALYDELTGLANRRLFYRKLEQAISAPQDGSLGAVMLLDLDFFKTINDTRGHQVGDELLKAVAKRLRHCLQESDVAARLGGDEFALLVSPVGDEESVMRIAERILDSLTRPFVVDETELQITTSLGIALVPKDGQEPDTLIKHADLAMYQAKEMGRNQFRFFTSSLHEQLQTYIRFTREMPEALERGEFLLNFQPQVDLTTGVVVGAEALIRWQHPELGIVPPPQFISVAEETGFIVPLGHWVVRTACEAMRELSARGYGGLRIAVNLSARQFRDPQLIGMISQVMEETGVEPSRLEVEITETLLMHDVESAIQTLQQLRDLGISVAIDDFGIGYSSFNYLKTLPIDVLKVDREFIKDIPQHRDDMEITAAIISMAHRLNLKVVAEGIETDVQQQFLQEHECDIGQGYLFSRPVELGAFLQLLPDAEPAPQSAEHEHSHS